MKRLQSIEVQRCEDYLQRSHDECDLPSWIRRGLLDASLVVSEGFEERSVGVLETFAQTRTKLPKVVVGRYASGEGVKNDRYRDRFDRAAAAVSAASWESVEHVNDGSWLQAALELTSTDRVIVDITPLSNKALFGVLDCAVTSGREVLLAYSEADEYWPRQCDWQALSRELSEGDSLPEVVNEKPWLFSYEHEVELIQDHEGYDSAGRGRALIGFLPFKCARLAAVLGAEDYAEFLFVAGRPRLGENRWRLRALKTVNQNIVKDRTVVDMDTFRYRKSLRRLTKILFSKERLAQRYDVHVAILGSKLQGVACWVLASLVPSLTMLTSVPSRYYPEAFSTGIGARWAFPLTRPKP